MQSVRRCPDAALLPGVRADDRLSCPSTMACTETDAPGGGGVRKNMCIAKARRSHGTQPADVPSAVRQGAAVARRRYHWARCCWRWPVSGCRGGGGPGAFARLTDSQPLTDGS